jgi:hypothetical protein
VIRRAADGVPVCAASQPPGSGFHKLGAIEERDMSTKYYAHFVAESADARGTGEYTGVVEVHSPLRTNREARDLRSVLARNFDLSSEDIRILQWARLH